MYEISLAPLQGVTDNIFRNTFEKHFSKLDKTYSPFIRVERGEVRKTYFRDIAPENNTTNLIPQVLTNNPDEFINLSKMMEQLGYSEMNWNLGCPFPPVAKHKLGSGLLAYPELIEELLTQVMPKLKTKLSLKIRTGYETEDDLEKVLLVLNQFPLEEIIIHTRYGKQQYKGDTNPDKFEEALKISKHKLAYNGDINTFQDFNQLASRFRKTKHFMLGRGLITNPFLLSEIRGETLSDDKKAILKAFHSELFAQFEERLNGAGHLLGRMRQFWEYLSLSFTNSRKVYKQIKKSTSVNKYNEAVALIFRRQDFVL